MADTSVIVWLQQFASPALTAFFSAITWLGALEFYMLAIPVIYWLVDKHSGFRFAVFFIFSAYVNSAVKYIFMTERPPRDLRLVTQEGYSFPSGHAQGSTAFWGFLAVHLKERWAAILAVVMIFLISFSRIYLGVHWPVDILGGLGIGLVLLFCYTRLARFKPEVASLGRWILGSLIITAILYFLHPTGDGPMTTGFLLGALIGYRLESAFVGFQEKALFWQHLLKLILGLGILFALRVVLKPLLVWLPESPAILVRYTCLGLWATLGAPWLFAQIGLSGKKPYTHAF